MITFSTCFYTLKSKFPSETYYQWMKNLISNVNCFNLVIYTDDTNYEYINSLIKNTSKVKIIIKPINKLFYYNYKEEWIKNQKGNPYLPHIDWELQAIWAEKIHFVEETIQKKYFDTEWYGWVDIGYFRGRKNDIPNNLISMWPNKYKIEKLDSNKIHYANTNNNKQYMNELFKTVNNKDINLLPLIPIPPTQNSIAGGFFLIHRDKIEWWRLTFDVKLRLYFENNYLVKDDQIILVDCIFSNLSHFKLYTEDNNCYDNWFMFQRLLL